MKSWNTICSTVDMLTWIQFSYLFLWQSSGM